MERAICRIFFTTLILLSHFAQANLTATEIQKDIDQFMKDPANLFCKSDTGQLRFTSNYFPGRPDGQQFLVVARVRYRQNSSVLWISRLRLSDSSIVSVELPSQNVNRYFQFDMTTWQSELFIAYYIDDQSDPNKATRIVDVLDLDSLTLKRTLVNEAETRPLTSSNPASEFLEYGPSLKTQFLFNEIALSWGEKQIRIIDPATGTLTRTLVTPGLVKDIVNISNAPWQVSGSPREVSELLASFKFEDPNEKTLVGSGILTIVRDEITKYAISPSNPTFDKMIGQNDLGEIVFIRNQTVFKQKGLEVDGESMTQLTPFFLAGTSVPFLFGNVIYFCSHKTNNLEILDTSTAPQGDN